MAGTLRSHLSRLRTLVGPDAALIARGGGYALAAGPEQLDAGRFERLARAGGEALEHGEAAAAAARFREALGLWCGRALADVADVEALARESARLEELRLVALEGRIEADVELGLAAEVAAELEGLVAGYPLRERLWRLLVLALYRGGRQADALAAYRRARTVLAEELGIEPGEELRQLERAVLRQQVPAAAPRREQHNLPARLTSFLGRERELAALEDLLGRTRLVTMTGVGGAGKTRLAVEFGADAAGRFRDGTWLADLAGITDPDLVPPQVMEALGVRQTGEDNPDSSRPHGPGPFASSGRRSAAQNEENPPPLRSGCRLVDGAHNKGTSQPGEPRPSHLPSSKTRPSPPVPVDLAVRQPVNLAHLLPQVSSTASVPSRPGNPAMNLISKRTRFGGAKRGAQRGIGGP
jgi:DNA-binding SARP family transcriptional activator